MKTKKFLLLFIMVIGIFATSSNLGNSSTNLNFVPVSEPNNASEEFYEDASITINNDGYIYANYYLSGPSIQLSEVDLDSVVEAYPEIFEYFSSAQWYFHSDNDDPLSQNVNIYLYFNTGDVTTARNNAEWIMGFVNAFSVTDYVESNIYIDSNWIQIEYRGHASWPNLLDVYDESLPRENGGIAATLNISGISSFGFSLSISGSSLYRSFSCSWPSTDVDYLEGSFSYDFADFIPVGQMQQTNTNINSNLRFSLPKVSNLVVEPSSVIPYHYEYQDSWQLDYWYDVSLTLTSTPVDHFTVSFDHKFVPYELQQRENAYVDANPYGYARKEIQIRHENSDFINWTAHFPDLYLYSESNYILDREGYDYDVSLYFHLRNLPLDDTETKAINFLNWIETNMPGGWEQTSNSNGSTSWWNGTESIDARYFSLRYNLTTMDETNWDLLWVNTWIYSHSNMMQETDLKTADSVRCYGSFTSNKGGYEYHYTEFVWNPLNRYETTLVKTFLPENNPSQSLSMYDLFGWSSFSKSEDFYRAYVSINVPINDLGNYELISPTSSIDGHYGAYTNNYDDHDELRCYMYSYTTIPTGDLVCNFEFDFHPDTDDLISPGGYVSTSNPYSGPSAQINFTATDTGNSDWWDEGYLDGTPHFPSSGIASVDYTLYFNALSSFYWEGSMTEYVVDVPEFGFTIDTTPMPDGWYTLESVITDESGNVGYRGDSIEIDNYPESLLAPSIDLISHNLTENDKLMGDEILIFNITDDVGIFASLITIGGSGWLLDGDSNPDPDLYEMNWSTEMYSEGYYLVTVTSWDMDGNETTVSYELEVDNRPIGNPPEISIIDPSEPDQLIENWFTFRANITDDFRLSSVQAQIDDRVPEDMVYNETSGLYEYEYDVSSLFNGTHTFTIIVYDFDENQHMVSSSIDFFANTTHVEDLYNPPSYRNLSPGNFRDSSDIVNGIVEISLEVSDDLGIQGVQLTISEVIGFDLTSYPSNPNSVDEDDISVVIGYPISMTEGEFDGTWTLYSDSFDTTTTTDGLYLVEITIGDIDPFSHIVTAKFLMIIKNTDPFAQIPGFTMEYFIGCIGISMLVGYLTIKRKYRSK